MVWNNIKKIGGLAFFVLLVSACGDIGGSGQCGGAGETGGCLRIENIAPEDQDGDFKTSNVDVLGEICDSSTKLVFDHTAKVKISYKPFPGSGIKPEDLLPVSLKKHAISYAIASCPGGGCPNLPVKTFSQTIDLSGGGSVTPELPFFTLQQKDEYVRVLGGPVDQFPSYIATYTLTGADSSGNPVKAEASAEFTIGNYTKCTTQ